MQHACMNNSRMHAALPSRVTGLASDQAGSTGLDPTQFKKKKKVKKIVFLSFNPNFTYLFTDARVKNTVFFRLHNIYQCQNWKYS